MTTILGKKGRGAKPKTSAEYFDGLKKKLDDICKGVAIGMTLTDACRAAGVDISTFYTWQKKALYNPAYAFFNEAVEDARAQGERSLAARIYEASKQDWRAAAWMLERRNPDIWSNKQTPTVNINATNNNNTVNVERMLNIDGMSTEKKEELLEKLKNEYKQELLESSHDVIDV